MLQAGNDAGGILADNYCDFAAFMLIKVFFRR